MKTRILLGVLFASFMTIAWGGFFRTSDVYAQDGGKNLKVLKGMSKADLKKYMKGVAKALGVQCDHCHDTDDMSKDTEKKLKAREMMQMVESINKNYFKGEKRVGCVTCHNGKTEPAK